MTPVICLFDSAIHEVLDDNLPLPAHPPEDYEEMKPAINNTYIDLNNNVTDPRIKQGHHVKIVEQVIHEEAQQMNKDVQVDEKIEINLLDDDVDMQPVERTENEPNKYQKSNNNAHAEGQRHEKGDEEILKSLNQKTENDQKQKDGNETVVEVKRIDNDEKEIVINENLPENREETEKDITGRSLRKRNRDTVSNNLPEIQKKKKKKKKKNHRGDQSLSMTMENHDIVNKKTVEEDEVQKTSQAWRSKKRRKKTVSDELQNDEDLLDVEIEMDLEVQHDGQQQQQQQQQQQINTSETETRMTAQDTADKQRKIDLKEGNDRRSSNKPKTRTTSHELNKETKKENVHQIVLPEGYDAQLKQQNEERAVNEVTNEQQESQVSVQSKKAVNEAEMKGKDDMEVEEDAQSPKKAKHEMKSNQSKKSKRHKAMSTLDALPADAEENKEGDGREDDDQKSQTKKKRRRKDSKKEGKDNSDDDNADSNSEFTDSGRIEQDKSAKQGEKVDSKIPVESARAEKKEADTKSFKSSPSLLMSKNTKRTKKMKLEGRSNTVMSQQSDAPFTDEEAGYVEDDEQEEEQYNEMENRNHRHVDKDSGGVTAEDKDKVVDGKGNDKNYDNDFLSLINKRKMKKHQQNLENDTNIHKQTYDHHPQPVEKEDKVDAMALLGAIRTMTREGTSYNEFMVEMVQILLCNTVLLKNNSLYTSRGI